MSTGRPGFHPDDGALEPGRSRREAANQSGRKEERGCEFVGSLSHTHGKLWKQLSQPLEICFLFSRIKIETAFDPEQFGMPRLQPLPQPFRRRHNVDSHDVHAVADLSLIHI